MEGFLARRLRRVVLGSLSFVAAMTLSTGVALAWTPTGNYTFNGSLTIGFGPFSGTVTCTTSFAVTLNAGVTNPGTVNSTTFNPCSTTFTNCTVAVTENESLWSIRGTNNGGGSGPVTIGGVAPDEMHLRATFSNVAGQTCTLQPNNCTVEARGSVTGSYAAGTRTLTYTNAGGLATSASTCTGIGVGLNLTTNGSLTETPATAPNPSLE
jgi:hypothetical protein